MAFIGTPLDTRNTFQSLQGKRFNGDGSTTAFTLDVAPSSTLDIEVFVGNVRQDPNSAYTLSGTTLTFTGAPPSGTNNIYVVHQAKSVGTIDVPTGGVQPGSLASNVISGQTLVTLDNSNDHVLINDATDGALKKALIPAASFAGIDDQSSSNDDQLTIKDAEVIINEDSDDVDFRVETNGQTHALFVNGAADGKVSINEASPDTGDGGLCLNQTSDDNFIFTLKSNDVAHSVTGEAEADTYMRMAKYSATQGGGAIVAYGEGGEGIYLQGVIGSGQGSTAKSTSAGAPVIIKGTKESSNAAGAMGSNENCAVILNHTNTRFIFDAEGDFHADASSTTFDAYEDAQLVRAYDLSHGKGVIDSKFDKFVAYNHEKLAELKLVGREENGTPNHFMNVTGMQRLHNGAIWQQYEKHNQLLEAVYDLAKEAVGEEKANAILDKHEVKRLN